MPRRYYRRSYRRSSYVPRSLKYSNETFRTTKDLDSIYEQVAFPYASLVVTAAVDSIQGTRKVKNFSLTLGITSWYGTLDGQGGFSEVSQQPTQLAFALVYVPEGLNPSPINNPNDGTSVSLYEPNQNVILSGIIDTAQIYKFKTRLGRNLNSGDAIYLLIRELGKATCS